MNTEEKKKKLEELRKKR